VLHLIGQLLIQIGDGRNHKHKIQTKNLNTNLVIERLTEINVKEKELQSNLKQYTVICLKRQPVRIAVTKKQIRHLGNTNQTTYYPKTIFSVYQCHEHSY